MFEGLIPPSCKSYRVFPWNTALFLQSKRADCLHGREFSPHFHNCTSPWICFPSPLPILYCPQRGSPVAVEIARINFQYNLSRMSFWVSRLHSVCVFGETVWLLRAPFIKSKARLFKGRQDGGSLRWNGEFRLREGSFPVACGNRKVTHRQILVFLFNWPLFW